VLIDLAPVDDTSPTEQLNILLRELESYDPSLLERPRVIVGTKTDSATAEMLEKWDGMMISAVTNQGVRDLVGRLASLVHDARQEQPVSEGRVILKPESDGAWVERLASGGFRVHGRKAERAVHLNDVTTPEAMTYIEERLKKLGVPRLLARAGAREGDVVWIADFSFDYSPDN
jgi:GTP-binding protein